MKKFFALLAVVLAVVSCQKDVDVNVNLGGDLATISVVLPEDAITRAGGTDSAASGLDNTDKIVRVVMHIYDEAGRVSNNRYVDYLEGDARTVNFDIRLVPNRKYTFVAWADQVDAKVDEDKYFNTKSEAGLANVTPISGTWTAMNEERDAFTATHTEANYTSSSNITLKLIRPFAKLRVVATDMEFLNDLDVKPTKAKVSYATKHYNAFNAVAGVAINKDNTGVKHEYNIASYNEDWIHGADMTLFTDYFFAADEQEVVNFSLEVFDQNNKRIKYNNFNTAIPVKRNNLTTIKGNVLTEGNDIKVTIDERFENGTEWNPGGDDYDVEVWDGVTVTEPSYNNETKTYTVKNGAELAWIAQEVNGVTRAAANSFKGKTVVLAKNINLGGHEWTPIGGAKSFEGTFNGNYKTVGDFKVTTQEGHAGLFGNAHATIKDLTVVNVTIVANHYAGAIVGQGYVRIDNCHVNNIDITLTTKNGDWGDKAGGIIGQNCEGSLYVKNSSAKNVKIQGYRDLGGIAGMAHNNNTVSGCSVENITILQDLSVNYQNSTPTTLGAVIGRKGANVTDSNNTTGEGIEIAVIIAEGLTQDTVSGDFNVSSAQGLAYIAEQVNEEGNTDIASGDIILNGDIDLASITTFATRGSASNWNPIGTSENPFIGTFDGNGCTIKNLVINGGSQSNIGFFGVTMNGEIKNVTFENAKVSGRLNVGVVAGTPYTSKYTNITVKGHVEVNGMAYVGAVGGKNAYADWTNITVNVDETSYVNANSVEDGKAYRTYVGGVCGFNGEGGHSFKNITSNINVKGSTCDVGGLFGIAHYGNQFENCVCTGNVEIYNASEEGDAQEIGGIAGVWHPGGADVVMTNCSFTGSLKANNNYTIHTYKFGNLVCAAYDNTGSGKLIINGKTYLASENTKVAVSTAEELVAALAEGKGVYFLNNITVSAKETPNTGYGAAGIIVANGAFLDGNNKTLTINNDAWGTWDCAIYTNGGLIKNLTVKGAMRGIFTGGTSADLYIENVTFQNVIYTFNSDAGNKNYGVYVSNSTLNGWTSHSDVHKEVVYTNCKFGKGSGYALCRPYGPTSFVGCAFEAGFEVKAVGQISFENCTIGGVALTVENLATLVTYNIANASVK